MKKILFAAMLVLATTLFWQCKDDPVWESPAIGSLGSTDLKIKQVGGAQVVRINATAGWSVAVKYIKGTGTSWCSASPTSGGPGENAITITAAANDEYDIRVAEVTVQSGSATKVFTVTVANSTIMDVKELTFNDVAHVGDTLAVPMLRNVECLVEIAKEFNWIEQLMESKSAPVEDTVFLVVNPYTKGLLPRKGEVVLYNKAFGYYDTVRISQLPTPKALFTTDTLLLDGKKQKNTSVKIESTADWTITPDQPTATWCTLSPLSGKPGETVLSVDVTETLRVTRDASFTLKADTMIRKLVVKQTELGEENGVFIVKGTSGYAAPSVIALGGNNLAAFYVGKTEARTDVLGTRTGGQAGPWDLSGKMNGGQELAQHMPLQSAVKSITVLGCTWSDSEKNANGFGGEINVKIFIWQGSYAASVAGTPVKTHFVEYNDNAQAQLLPAGYTLPAGDYLVCMSSTHPRSGLWIGTGFIDGFETFTGGVATTDKVADYKITFAGQSDPAAFMKKSTDNGATWGAASVYTPLTTLMNAKTTNLKVVHAGGKIVATFNKADGSYWMQAPSLDGPWTARTASAQGDLSKAVAQWSGVTGRVSVVAFGGSLYAYYLDGNKLMCVNGGSVATASFAGKSAVTAYTFADQPASTDVQAVSAGQLELLWINKAGKAQHLLSASATTFTGAGAAVDTYVFPGSRWLSRLSGEDGFLKNNMPYLRLDGIYYINK